MNIEHFIVDDSIVFRPLDGVADFVDRLLHSEIVQGDREGEMILSRKEFVDVLLAVKAFVEHIVKVLYIQLLEGSQKVMHRLYVGNVARNPVVVHRQLALLTEDETDFRKLSQRSIARR